jgi:hypothetical protein
MLTPRVMIGFGSDQGIYGREHGPFQLESFGFVRFSFFPFFKKKKRRQDWHLYIILRKTKLQRPKSWKQKIKKRE